MIENSDIKYVHVLAKRFHGESNIIRLLNRNPQVTADALASASLADCLRKRK
ncbi:hypothetical protein ACQKII_03040 [Lysinibacillus sp. NPDC048646]|uniref:hypothetical protein n=1 Tax=Lysinibacillus sp. NPDC048646 TaxID=3390574 RepID=UPI003CFDCDFB